ncbi:hypothetical protein NDU88_006031 [Pleurodeles waltl]|uniref:Uncharacterized protein n=1 Tax=Pleurodeles waltl TaxID=8319 RepID=A0AAV7MB18_PLEWA|nr:hypothetical protein NDU88_006031 [Pleurodeles waltl]
MEDVVVVEQQDDLERMLAQMRAEALKQGKDWLRKEMEDTGPERGTPPAPEHDIPAKGDNSETKSEMDHARKPNKRQRPVGKPAKKAAKRTRGPERDTAPPSELETPESISSRKSTDGEHISAIIKECLKSITPLLLKSGGAGSGPDCQENCSKG